MEHSPTRHGTTLRGRRLRSGRVGSKFTRTRKQTTRSSRNGVATVAHSPRLRLFDPTAWYIDAFHASGMQPHDPGMNERHVARMTYILESR